MVYFIVSPDPAVYPNGVVNAAGAHCFFIKFGDGAPPVPGNTRYSSHNPSYSLQNCTHFDGGATYADPTTHELGVRICRFLQNKLLSLALPNNQVDSTEWFTITANHGNTAALQVYLANLLVIFPNQHFDHQAVTHVLLTTSHVAMEWMAQQSVAMLAVGH